MHSVKNLSTNKIKEIAKLHQKKYRDESCLFLAEGNKALEEIINSKIEFVEIYATDKFQNKMNIPTTLISENEMKKIATTSSPCEVLTIAKKKEYSINQIKNKNRIILLDSISDPGNLGTIIRSAAAFDIDGIILFGDCVEIYSPKVIRSTTGNLFKTPIISIKNLEDIKKHFNGHKIIATALSKENNISINELSNTDKYIVMFGSEATGLKKELIEIADKNIQLKMNKNVESLNLSVSASIIMYELFINRN